MGRLYGALLSPPDERDHAFTVYGSSAPRQYPVSFTVPHTSVLYDQDGTEMCVAFSIAQVREVQEEKESGVRPHLSPLWVYGNRSPEDYQGEGMCIRQALQTLTHEGLPLWDDLPGIGTYPEAAAAVARVKPLLEDRCLAYRAVRYMRLQSADEIKSTLMDFGPVVVCIAVIPVFETAGDGRVPLLPSLDGVPVSGYHAMMVVGWDVLDGIEYLVVENTWGEAWGDHGRGYIPVSSPVIMEMWGVVDLVN